MSTTTMRLGGIICLVAAAAFFILNLKRVANLGTYFVALPLLFIGILFMVRSKRRE